ncbi:hypothetical protein [Bradyrhizobium sp. ARR65]|uniref:hypothetical protein n=1 Tax=Bradyrhizobium sp. ARR65 TaxID=1040989 RepID=UPI00046589AF|nr:hypothetical protein [Bradyrhizobium sp. ARR65]
MEYAAGALAVFGAILGLRFRFRVLLPFVMLLFLACVLFSFARGLGWLETLLIILVSEAILQGCYFGGLLIRRGFKFAQRKLPRSWSERVRL